MSDCMFIALLVIGVDAVVLLAFIGWLIGVASMARDIKDDYRKGQDK